MDYTFIPDPASKPYRITINQDHLHVICGKEEKMIPFDQIARVQMEKRRGVFKTHLDCKNHFTITIASKSFLPHGKNENKEAQYGIFIRLLHHHLITKSKAEFTTSTNFAETWRWITLILSASAILFFVIDYLNWKLDYLTIFMLSVGIIAPAFVLFWLGRLPRSYKPSDIPLEFLP